MDILKILINNPGLQHVAEIVIGHLDKDFAWDLAEDREYRELFTEYEQDFLMKRLRKQMYAEAKKICEEKRKFYGWWEDLIKSFFDMFPFFAEALKELKSSESLLTFQQLQQTLSLLENIVNGPYGRFKPTTLRWYDDHHQDFKKGPEDMIKALNQYWTKNYWN